MASISIARTPVELRARCTAARATGARVALTPTMGALHAGHLSLIEIARRRADLVIASIFVNPTQFAPNEDFHAYPRDEANDARLLAGAGCDLIYAPTPEAIYPPGFSTIVSVSGVSAPLEGEIRPQHFSGVATVVAKLLIQAAPDIAVFGEKDFQQLQVVRRLVRDLDLPVEIVSAPIARYADGLALSSRNAYLTPDQRAAAPALYKALVAAARSLSSGVAVAEAEQAGRAALMGAGFDQVDYFEVRGAADLDRLGSERISRPARILAAARIGRTRLIDNVAADLPGADQA